MTTHRIPGGDLATIRFALDMFAPEDGYPQGCRRCALSLEYGTVSAEGHEEDCPQGVYADALAALDRITAALTKDGPW